MKQELRDKAWQWMRENPDAYKLFCRYANQIAQTGQKFGAKLIAERIRWECKLQKIGKWKWSNNHTKYVAMRWASEHQQYAHLITFRNEGVEYQQELF